ncbi:MAG TPA: FtsW/RodA/SpoVE family cell cycle protein [Clostridiales bacterium]|nr:FtsW/RodA/SpoVE family cell cycle protein [Clostridiales bacterium]
MKNFFARIADYIRESDKLLMLLCFFSSVYGCIAVLSATRPTGDLRQFIVQVAALILGFACAIFVSLFDYKNIARFWPAIAFVGLIPVFLTFYIGVAPDGTDDKAWLLLPGGISFQPSELLKISFMITFAFHLYKLEDRIHSFLHILLLCLHAAIPVLIIHFQGDDGTALIFAFIALCMMFVSGIKLRYFIIASVLGLTSVPFVFFFILSDQQRSRILTLFNPESDLLGTGWQQWRGRIALANGGLFGRGLFKGPNVQAQTVPEGYNDFIFASIGEELGLLGCLVVILLLSAICLRVLSNAHKSRDSLGSFICVGVFAMLTAQIIVNLGMCLSLSPVIGVTLPFFSAGGSSVVCLYLGIGLVLSVYMHRNSRTIYLRD